MVHKILYVKLLYKIKRYNPHPEYRRIEIGNFLSMIPIPTSDFALMGMDKDEVPPPYIFGNFLVFALGLICVNN